MTPSKTDDFYRRFISVALIIFLFGAGGLKAAPIYGYRIIAKYPHSTASYTEGFFYLDGLFYEGTGRTGRSAVLAINPKTGESVLRHDLPPQLFGEGIVDWGPYLLEWTWTSHVCFVYDRLTLRQVTSFTYTGEGWGMTRTATELITSDGTATLRFRDPNTFQETRQILVKDGSKLLINLMNSNLSKARFTPMSGIQTWLREFLQPMVTSSPGLTLQVCSLPIKESMLNLF